MNIAYIRKLAAVERGRRLVEQPDLPVVSAVTAVQLEKGASAVDRDLLCLASRLGGDTLETYEALGGTFG